MLKNLISTRNLFSHLMFEPLSNNSMKAAVTKQLVNPIFQASMILVSMLVFMLISKAIRAAGLESATPIKPWEVMASFVLFFALVNCVFSLQTSDQIKYWRNSIFCFVALLLFGGLMSWGVSGLSVFEAGSISWILFIFSFCYLIFLSIVNLMRFIVELAQKQDSRLRGESDSSTKNSSK